MLLVLIAEDEALVRIGLKSSVDWEKLNMRVIADVPNGQNALEIYYREKPDLILTDIKMPVMDGLQLISNIREKDKTTKIIILTCHEEFELVHKALQLGVSDYILKLKMSPKDIEAVLMKIGEEIKKEKVDSPQNLVINVDTNIIKENLFKEYIFYHTYSDERFAQSINQLNLRLLPENMVLSIMSIDRFAVLQQKFKDQQGNLIHFAIINILNEILSGFKRGEAFHEKEGRYIILCSFSDIVDESRIQEILFEILARIRVATETYIGIPVTFFISTLNHSYSSLQSMYSECMTAIEQDYFMEEEKYISCHSLQMKDVKATVVHKLKGFAASLDPFVNDYHKKIISEIDALILNINLSKPEIQKAIIRWMNWPANQMSIDKDSLSRLILEYNDRIQDCSVLNESLELFTRFYFEVKKLHTNTRYIKKEVADAVEYLKINYYKDITLQEVAEQVEMNPSYLSSLFKSEMKQSFTEYLNQVRIEMSKDILLNTHVKTYIVAEKVGYSDNSYFIRMFKKYTGMKPNEFRKHLYLGLHGDKQKDD